VAESFSPYQEWLGLAADVVRPSYYQLLGLADGETDLEKIAVAGDRAATRVRSHRPGPHARLWSELLDEIFAAKSCLLDPASKSEYDLRLARISSGSDSGNREARVEPTTPVKAPIDGDRYPPGMAPPGARPGTVATAKATSSHREPNRSPVPAAESESLTPAAGAYGAASSPATYSAVASHGAQVAAAANPEWSASAAPASTMPTGYVPMALPLAGYPGTYPPASYGQPQSYGQPMGYAQPVAQPPMGQPYSYPAAHPVGYGYGPVAPMAVPPPAPPPQVMADAMGYYGTPTAQPLDPMAPVALPGYGATAFPGSDAAGQRIVGFAGAVEPMPQATKHEIPLGTALPAAAPAEVPVGMAVGTSVPVGFGEISRQAESSMVSSSSVAADLEVRRAQQLRRNILIAGLGGGALVIVAMLIYANVPPTGEGVASIPAETNPADDVPQPMARTVESALPGTKRSIVPPTPQPNPQPAPEPAPEPKPAAPAPEPMPSPSPMPEPMVPAPSTTPGTPSEPESKPDPAPVPESAPVPAPMPEPSAPAPEPMPMPAATAADLAALGKALALGKAALTEQNFEEADKFIAEAEGLAKSDEHRKLVARLKEVGGYVRQFRQAVVLAASEMDGGEAFKVGTSTLVAMVEATPDKVIVRHTGQNKTYPYADLPPGLAVAIADFKLDASDPVSRVVKGSFYAVARGDQVALHDKAKTWWEEAQLGGVDLAHLMPFLTDRYDLAKSDEGVADAEATMPAGAKSKTKTKTGAKSKTSAKADQADE
jgi:hypothetical protein